jgi:type I restriction enzyme S subunit
MKFQEVTIDKVVSKCTNWNPIRNGDDTFAYIDLSSVDNHYKSIVSVERYLCIEAPSRARQLVKAGDVLIATVRPNLNCVALVDHQHDGMTASTGFCVLRPKRELLDSAFLFHWVKTKIFVQRMVDLATGANYPAVSDSKVKSSTIPLPPLPEQKRIAAILDVADAMRAKRRESLAQLDALIQSTFLDMFGDPVSNPKDWTVVSMESVVGGSFRNGLSASTLGTIEGKVLTLSAITSGRFDGSFWKSVKFDRQPSDNQMLSSDTFLICRGNGNKAMVGIGVFPTGNNDTISFPDTMIASTPDQRQILPAFLQHVWASALVRSQILTGARTTNGTFKVNQKVLSGIKFPNPPLDLQRRFATIVEAVEKQKDRLRAHLAELDTLFASLQHRAFNGEL